MDKNFKIGAATFGVVCFGTMLKLSTEVTYIYPNGLFISLLSVFSISTLIISIYLVFLKKNTDGITDWQINLSNLSSRKNRIAKSIFVVIFWPIFSLVIGWCLTKITVLPTEYWATEKFETIATIVKIKDAGRATDKWSRLYLQFNTPQYSETVKWPKYDVVGSNINVGDIVKIEGRQWAFGQIAERITVIEQ